MTETPTATVLTCSLCPPEVPWKPWAPPLLYPLISFLSLVKGVELLSFCLSYVISLS